MIFKSCSASVKEIKILKIFLNLHDEMINFETVSFFYAYQYFVTT